MLFKYLQSILSTSWNLKFQIQGIEDNSRQFQHIFTWNIVGQMRIQFVEHLLDNESHCLFEQFGYEEGYMVVDADEGLLAHWVDIEPDQGTSVVVKYFVDVIDEEL